MQNRKAISNLVSKKNILLIFAVLLVVSLCFTFLYLKAYRVKINNSEINFNTNKLQYLKLDTYNGIVVVDVNNRELLFLKPFAKHLFVDKRFDLNIKIDDYSILDVADRNEEFCLSSYKEIDQKFFNKISCFSKTDLNNNKLSDERILFDGFFDIDGFNEPVFKDIDFYKDDFDGSYFTDVVPVNEDNLLFKPDFNIERSKLIFLNEIEIKQDKIGEYANIIQKISSNQNNSLDFLEYARFPKFKMQNGIPYRQDGDKIKLESIDLEFNLKTEVDYQNQTYRYPEMVNLLTDNTILLVYESTNTDTEKELLFVTLNANNESIPIMKINSSDFLEVARNKNSFFIVYNSGFLVKIEKI